MELFDGYIAAIASEFNMKFDKESDGIYNTRIEFENDRHQDVLIKLLDDESGDKMIHFYSNIMNLKDDSLMLFKHSLQINSELDYGAIVMKDDKLMLKNAILMHQCEPQRFMKNLVYVAAKADELEEQFTNKDKF